MGGGEHSGKARVRPKSRVLEPQLRSHPLNSLPHCTSPSPHIEKINSALVSHTQIEHYAYKIISLEKSFLIMNKFK